MNYFVMVCACIFLGVMLFIDIIKHFIDERYWSGLHIVPILLFANIFLGIFYNQSVWFKLTDKTKFGAYIALFGAVITIIVNWIWIPEYGYLASAWATFICYGSMMVLSYLFGQKYYPVPYNLKKIVGYLSLAFAFYFVSTQIQLASELIKYAIHSGLLLGFVTTITLIERPKF